MFLWDWESRSTSRTIALCEFIFGNLFYCLLSTLPIYIKKQHHGLMHHLQLMELIYAKDPHSQKALTMSTDLNLRVVLKIGEGLRVWNKRERKTQGFICSHTALFHGIHIKSEHNLLDSHHSGIDFIPHLQETTPP